MSVRHSESHKMQGWAKDFVAELHKRGMKPRGFMKKRLVFTRKLSEHLERIQIQGSSWNSSTSPSWDFYVNAGVLFSDLPPMPANKGFSGAHVYGRLGSFVAGLDDSFSLTERSTDEVMSKVLLGVDQACSWIQLNRSVIHQAAEAGQVMWHHSQIKDA